MEPLNLTVGVLTYNAPETLKHTLDTYQKAGMFEAVNEVIVCIQHSPRAQEELDVVKSLNEPVIWPTMLDDNKWIGKGFRKLVHLCTDPYILLLENDSPCYGISSVYENLKTGIQILKNNDADVVRYRSKHNPGEPLYSWHLKGRELTCLTHLAECIHWNDEPDVTFPDYCKKLQAYSDNWYQFSSKHANFTNNPCMYRKRFYDTHILPYCRDNEDIETRVQNEFWPYQDFKVASGPGLFTHMRKDGK